MEDLRQTIWKSALRITYKQEIVVPAGAEFLCARGQGDNICVWFRCDPNAAMENWVITVVGTGHPVPDDVGAYIGTALIHSLVFHVFGRSLA